MNYTTFNLEILMRSSFYRKAINFAVATVFLVFAEVGALLTLANQTFPVSFIWPAAGVSLAAFLLFGRRCWIGVFLGNLIHNLFIFGFSDLFGLSVGFFITLGSFSQAALGAYIIRKLSPEDSLKSLKNVLVFLLFGGVFTCFIASTTATTTLFFAGLLPANHFFSTWITFWLGDTLGIYLITPLILVWALQKPLTSIKDYAYELIIMIALFIGLSITCFYYNIPLMQFYFPLCLWIVYRFQLHGGTVTLLLLSFISLTLTKLSFGVFYQVYGHDALFFLTLFLGILISTCLVLGTLVFERVIGWRLLESQNINLEESLKSRSYELLEVKNLKTAQEKLLALSTLALKISQKIAAPHTHLKVSLDGAYKCMEKMRAKLISKKESFPPDFFTECKLMLGELDKNINDSIKFQNSIHKTVLMIEDHTQRALLGKIKLRLINFHTLIFDCIEKLEKLTHASYPKMHIEIKKDFARTSPMVTAILEDLTNAINTYLNQNIASIVKKWEKEDLSYDPVLEITTEEKPDAIILTLKDNGDGLSEDELSAIRCSFFGNDDHFLQNYAICYANDMICHVHSGQVEFSSEPDQFLKITITLPNKD